MEFTIPADTPDGEYLVRPEHIAIHEGHVGKAQFYMECAQLRVSGGGSGSPGPMTQIPGLYTADEVNFDMWTSPAPSTYAMPGPAVWSGGGSSGGSSSSGSSSGDSSSSGSNSTGASPVVASSGPAWDAGSWGAGSWGFQGPSTFATVVSVSAPTAK